MLLDSFLEGDRTRSFVIRREQSLDGLDRKCDHRVILVTRQPVLPATPDHVSKSGQEEVGRDRSKAQTGDGRIKTEQNCPNNADCRDEGTPSVQVDFLWSNSQSERSDTGQTISNGPNNTVHETFGSRSGEQGNTESSGHHKLRDPESEE